MPDQGPEPTPWELMRGLQRIEASVEKLGGKVVSTDLYLADKSRSDARLRTLEEQTQEAEKLRRQQRLTITLAIASPVLVIAAQFVLRGGLVP